MSIQKCCRMVLVRLNNLFTYALNTLNVYIIIRLHCDNTFAATKPKQK